ncbi:MAG: DUF3263 domain-containing protein [Arcanobacterium sp.]|nr:DUF3263 domain-containing protein [Arcanobacterium sp.]
MDDQVRGGDEANESAQASGGDQTGDGDQAGGSGQANDGDQVRGHDQIRSGEHSEVDGTGVPTEQHLSELERAVLRVERGWWRIARTREAAIKNETGLPPSRYYVLLSTLIDEPHFWRADPVLVDRLRRLRDHKFDEWRRG